jgi:hypothetical protein
VPARRQRVPAEGEDDRGRDEGRRRQLLALEAVVAVRDAGLVECLEDQPVPRRGPGNVVVAEVADDAAGILGRDPHRDGVRRADEVPGLAGGQLDERNLGRVRDRIPAQRPVGVELGIVLVDREHDPRVDAGGRPADCRDRGVCP